MVACLIAQRVPVPDALVSRDTKWRSGMLRFCLIATSPTHRSWRQREASRCPLQQRPACRLTEMLAPTLPAAKVARTNLPVPLVERHTRSHLLATKHILCWQWRSLRRELWRNSKRCACSSCAPNKATWMRTSLSAITTTTAAPGFNPTWALQPATTILQQICAIRKYGATCLCCLCEPRP